jgi:hypothetical protein
MPRLMSAGGRDYSIGGRRRARPHPRPIERPSRDTPSSSQWTCYSRATVSASSSPPAPAHDADAGQRDWIRHLPHHRHHDADAAVGVAGDRRLGGRRAAGDGRRPHLRGDGLDVPTLGGTLRVPERGLWTGLGVPLRVGMPARDPDGQRRHRGGGLRRVLQLLLSFPGHRPRAHDPRHAMGPLESQRRPARRRGVGDRHHEHQLRRHPAGQYHQRSAHRREGGRSGRHSPAGHRVRTGGPGVDAGGAAVGPAAARLVRRDHDRRDVDV